MENKLRMSKIWAWLLGLVVLVAIGFLLACGTTYNSSSDGLVLVTSQGAGLVETWSFSLGSGHTAAVQNSPNDTANQVCVLNAIPSSIVVVPGGAYAYTLLTPNASDCTGGSPITTEGIATFNVNSNGTLTQTGKLTTFATYSVGVCLGGAGVAPTIETVPANPKTLVMDSAGKFLFVADSSTLDTGGNAAPGAVSVFAIGSGGSLTEVAGSPFTVPVSCAAPPSNLTWVAPTPTAAPPLLFGQSQSVCSAPNPFPTSEYLYAVDSNDNGGVWEFAVNTSTGVLTAPPGFGSPQYVPSGARPSGVIVDPCDRFVYVSNAISNNISAYRICTSATANTIPPCIADNGQLFAITGSPYSLSNGAQGPGPLVVDVYGNYLYVLDTISNTISPFRISGVTGALSIMNPATVATGQGATSIVIRSDDNWVFVTNYIAATVSQYALAPGTGQLSPQLPINTDNYPYGVAVK
jgi:hypothetical protein